MLKLQKLIHFVRISNRSFFVNPKQKITGVVDHTIVKSERNNKIYIPVKIHVCTGDESNENIKNNTLITTKFIDILNKKHGILDSYNTNHIKTVLRKNIENDFKNLGFFIVDNPDSVQVGNIRTTVHFAP